MKISYIYTLEDYEALNRARITRLPNHKLWTAFFWTIVAGNLLVGAWLITSAISSGRSLEWHHFANIVLAVLLFLSRFVLAPKRRRQQFRNQMLENTLTEVSIDDQGITTSNERATGSIKWQGIYRVDNEPGHIIFWSSKIMGVPIPKSAMNKAQIDEIEQLVAANFSNRTNHQ